MRRLRRSRRPRPSSERDTYAFGTPSASTCSLPCDAERGDHPVCQSAVVCAARRADRSGRHRLGPDATGRGLLRHAVDDHADGGRGKGGWSARPCGAPRRVRTCRQMAAVTAASSAGSPALGKEPKSKIAAGPAASTTWTLDGTRSPWMAIKGSSAGLAAIQWSTQPARKPGHRRGEHVPVVGGRHARPERPVPRGVRV